MTPALRAAFAALALAVAPAAADDAADIQSVIRQQLDAFSAADWAGAYDHASPTIQRQFRNPDAFARMVRGGYPMVVSPRSIEVGPLEQGPNGPIQIMRFVDGEGVEYVAAYVMKQVDGRWRIDGVHIRKVPDATA